MAGGVTVNNIARWDGTNWSAIGSGVNGFVNGIAVSGNTLYAGGFFTSAGGSAANYAAMANLAPLTILTGNAAFGFASGYFGFDVTGPSGSNAVIQGSADLRTWVPLQTNQLSNGMFHFSDTQYPGTSQWFYRVQLGP